MTEIWKLLIKIYEKYIGQNQNDYIKICVDEDIDTGSLKIGNSNYNYNTLEPETFESQWIRKN